MHDINTYLFMLIHQGARFYPILDSFFIVLTTSITFGVIALVLIYICCIHPFRTSDARVRLRRIGAAVEGVVSLFITWSIISALKVFIAMPRPFMAIEDIKPLVEAAPFESFPSAHAALTIAIAIAVLPYHRHLGHLLIAFSIIVSLSRLFVGVHYPFDVVVGTVIGILIPKLVQWVFRGTSKKALDLQGKKA